MRLRKNTMRRNEARSQVKTNWISKLEDTISAAVEAIASLVRTQFLLTRGRRGEISSGIAAGSKNLSGPYSSLLFAIITYSAMWVMLNWLLDKTENLDYGQGFNLNDLYPELSWASNVRLILPMFIWVPLVGIAFSFVIAPRDVTRQQVIRDLYVYAISSFLWHLSLLIPPLFASALIRKQREEWTALPGLSSPETIGVFMLNDVEIGIGGVAILLVALRVAWVFESNVNITSPRRLPRRIAICIVATVVMPVSVIFSLSPIMQQYFRGTDYLNILGRARLVDAETIDIELVFTSERKNPIIIRSDDISFRLWNLKSRSMSSYPVYFYSTDGEKYTYIVLEPGHPTILQASVYFKPANSLQGIWPFDRNTLASMPAGICVTYRTVRTRSRHLSKCIEHQIQGPPREGS